MGAAGIHADIAADGTGKLRAGIGCIKETFRTGRIGNGKIGNARLHPRRAIVKIQFEDRGHLREADHHRILLRDRAAGKRGAGAPRHDRNTVTVAIFHHRRHLFRGSAAPRPAAGGDRKRRHPSRKARSSRGSWTRQSAARISFRSDMMRSRLATTFARGSRNLIGCVTAPPPSTFPQLVFFLYHFEERNQMLWIFSITEIIRG